MDKIRVIGGTEPLFIKDEDIIFKGKCQSESELVCEITVNNNINLANGESPIHTES